ncbi:hypothetical protein V1264_016624 [Littorina saxatilis]|uniref:Uncharacterized protein n=1 Tax=Littorina saxatilis TaxID=31220 RepID=A0AAN9BGQ9_9CAEN
MWTVSHASPSGSPLALPPPVSHGLRCRLPDSVALGDILPAARDERPRDSIVSALGHIYNEINDDVEQGMYGTVQ